MAKRGLMVVLDGSDGAGKNTQLNLLAERLKAAGYNVATFAFPQYEKESSYFIRQYLSGAFGNAVKVSPYTAALFYALDRYEAAESIRRALKEGKIVLVDRYVGANMAHQGAKFADPVEQRGFFVWEDNLEFQLLRIPRPDVNFFLRVPADVSAKLIKQRAAETGVVRDEHEKNSQFLKKSVATYDLLCRLFPKDFTAIECTKNGQLLGIPQISDLIWKKLKPLLPDDKPNSGHPAVVTLGLNTPSQNHSEEKNAGNDRLHQKFVNTSLLLKVAVERQVMSVDPPGFSIWSDNSYSFYTPMGLPRDVEKIFKSTMSRLADLHREMRSLLENYYKKTLLSSNGKPTVNISSILLPATPMAALNNFGAVLSARSAERLAKKLLASDSQELQWTAKQLYLAARQVWPAHFAKPLEAAGNPEPINNIITKLVEDKLSLNSSDSQIAKLLEANPRQEFDLLAESIYPYSSLSLEEIREEVSNWSYQQKYESLKKTVGEPQLLSKIQYKFDVISDQLTLSEAVNSAILSSVQVQTPSPRFGYDVPAVVEESGIEDLYMECFDKSLKLFSTLQQAGRDDLTVYASLLGHKLRWQFQADATNLKSLIKHRGSENLQAVTEIIKDAVAEAHPLTWDVLMDTSPLTTSTELSRNRVKPSKRRRTKSRKPAEPTDK
ncbi:MAG TPA: thymidylate kinase [Candidatus Saccharimonadales bacterium]|nr:thymidylate kinase [Candidatus Saccharimonadales bacterium]